MNKTITVAKAINQALTAVFEQDDRVYLLGEDVLDPYGGAFKISKGLSSRWPERVLTTPISEAAFTGIAAGMALRGERPVIEIMFGDFITLAFDQILNHITKYNLMYGGNVDCPVVIRTPMGGGRGYGPTHSQSLEKFFIGVPGLNVVALNRFHNTNNFYSELILKEIKPSLIIENKQMYGRKYIGEVSEYKIFDVEYKGDLIPSVLFTPKSSSEIDVCLISYSGCGDIAIEAAEELLMENEIFTSVLILGTLSPLPLKAIEEFVEDVKQIVIVEEGSLVLGIGAEISAILMEQCFDKLKAPVQRIAAQGGVIPCAAEKEKIFLPGAKMVVDRVLDMLEKS
ncbi:MAG: hypothetical protein JKY80_02225 [Mariprofundaceae bacterium]|nr:hypothetical protein [Mariprofundaceae bacterium]